MVDTLINRIEYLAMLTLRARIAFIFGMSFIMALIMSGLLVALNTGIDSQFLGRWMHSFAVAFPIAFITAGSIAPWVQKLVDRIFPNG